MSPEAQRIAIAEACGMIGPFESREEWFENGDSDGWKIVLRDATGKRVPDYLNDLNAMHEAEKILTHDQANSFTEFLWSQYPGHVLFDSYIWHATAAQRAEAFLRTIGKWKEASK
jgi:hypothetical protein